MPNVFVVQETGRIDITPAREFGEIITMLPPGDTNFSYPYIVRCIKECIESYAKPDDFLLLTGDPVSIGIATTIMSKRFARLRFLKWLPRERQYLPVTVDL